MVKRNLNQEFNFNINDEITLNEDDDVRIIGKDIESRVVKFKDAMSIAESMEMDLIDIKSTATPRILRIEPYDKFIFDLKKKSKKKPQSKPMKEIDLKVNIADHDLETKANQAREFLKGGSKVKVVLTMRGRELTRRAASQKCFFTFLEMLSDVSVQESLPREDGNRTSTILKHK